MGKKTRYLQLSSTIMMEYELQGEGPALDQRYLRDGFVFTKLLDGHYAVFSPLSSEVSVADGKKLPNNMITTTSTINHLAVPEDKKCSNWFSFLDPDYRYTTDGNIGIDLDLDDTKVSEYARYCLNPVTGSSDDPFVPIEMNERGLRADTLKLYFVNGYDFSNVYGLLARITLTRNDGGVIDLCNYFINRSNYYKLIRFMASPIIFGDNIYDRYLEIRLPSIYDLTMDPDFIGINSKLDVSPSSSVGLSFAYIDDESYVLSDISRDIPSLIKMNSEGDAVDVDGNEICEFVRSSSVRGVVPAEKIPSDNLGVYIAENPEYPYIEFCGTWGGRPLSYEIVQGFNRGDVKLYDQRLIKKRNYGKYEVDDDYSADLNLKKWVVMHEIVCDFIGIDGILLRTETYNMSQIFISDKNEQLMFQFRPTIFDDALAVSVRSIHARYTMRLMNIEDGVQFVKTGSISLVDGENTTMAKFYGKGVSLPSDIFCKYDVHNKIVEVKRDYYGGSLVSPKTKYVKVFYDTSELVLMNADGSERFDPYTYTLTLSNVPKNYKFIIKRQNQNPDEGPVYVDLTDGYYKLYTRDANGNEITIDPTYSENMNLMLGEIEFNINSNVLNRLVSVPEGERKMSIVSISDNNVVSSMLDFVYNF